MMIATGAFAMSASKTATGPQKEAADYRNHPPGGKRRRLGYAEETDSR
jgi:hypothetical protein